MSPARRADKALDPEFLFKSADHCPDVATHTPCPTGYLERMEWYEGAGRKHRQKRCDTCRYWSVWVPKRSDGSGCEAMTTAVGRVCKWCRRPMPLETPEVEHAD